MDFLKGFTSAFTRIKDNPMILIPIAIGVGVALILDLIIRAFGVNIVNNVGGAISVLWLTFIFEVVKWAVAFAMTGWIASLMLKAKQANDDFSKSFLDFFVLGLFMAFFLMVGTSIHIIVGIVVFLFLLFLPVWLATGPNFKTMEGFRWNLSFMFKGMNSAYALILLLGSTLLTMIPFVGIYLALFFYMVWAANIYVYIKNLPLKKAEEAPQE